VVSHIVVTTIFDLSSSFDTPYPGTKISFVTPVKKLSLLLILVFTLSGLLSCVRPSQVHEQIVTSGTNNPPPVSPAPAATPEERSELPSTEIKDLHLPPSEDYPVAKSDMFKGKPAVPALDTRRARMYKTVITEGAKEGPDFAGRYTVVTWGAGMGNFSMVVVDAKTGKLFYPPFESVSRAAYGLPIEGADGNPAYKLESRLVAISGCPGKEYEGCSNFAKDGLYIYDFKNGRFKLVRFVKNDDFEKAARQSNK
jgi:hypothetical protein